MNTTTFTTKQLKKSLIDLVLDQRGVTENICGFDPYLCEITENCEDIIDITFAEEDMGFIDMKWSLNFNESCEGAADGWTFKYQTIIETSILKSYII